MDMTGKTVYLKEGAWGAGKSKLLEEILREKIRRGCKIITVIDISPDKGNEIQGKENKD